MTTNATVEEQHKDMAAKAAGYRDWTHGFGVTPDQCSLASLRAHAQALANLEAARAENADLTNRLAKMTALIRFAHDTLMEINPSNYDHDDVCKMNAASVEVILALAPMLGETHGKTPEWWAKLASSHTPSPSPCPGCAAKGEELAAFKADVSDTVNSYFTFLATNGTSVELSESEARFSRFIIPPADPLAEALIDILQAAGVQCDDITPTQFAAALAELKSRLGGA